MVSITDLLNLQGQDTTAAFPMLNLQETCRRPTSESKLERKLKHHLFVKDEDEKLYMVFHGLDFDGAGPGKCVGGSSELWVAEKDHKRTTWKSCMEAC